MSVMAGRIGYASPAENWRTIFFFLGDWVDLLSIAEPAAIALQAAWGEKKKRLQQWVGGPLERFGGAQSQPSHPAILVDCRRQFSLAMTFEVISCGFLSFVLANSISKM